MRNFLMAIVATVSVLIAGTSVASAQDYDTAVGVSLGGAVGVNLKVKVSGSSAIEAGVDYTSVYNAVNLYAVWQYHLPLAKGLYGYAGGGLNVGAQYLGSSAYSTGLSLGISPNLGMEYRFNNTPIVLGLDYRPSINIIGYSLWSNASLKVRFVF